MDEFLKKETSFKNVNFWGVEYSFSPYLCKDKLGDGLQLISVIPLDFRPRYWLVLIDSKTDVESELFAIDEILELIEDECDRAFEYDRKTGELFNEYPAFNWEGGSWGHIATFVK
jgi:hypothetical protein